MDTMDAIFKRRSIRFYEETKIDKDILEQIIDAGNHAPTGGGNQMWRFVVVTDDGFRAKLAELALSKYKVWMEEKAPEPLKAMRAQIDAVAEDPVYYSAPAVVFVIGKGMTATLDCPMVCENMMLAARSFGIGSCWVFFGQLPTDEPEIRTALQLEEGEQVFGPILLGYPQEDQPPRAPKADPRVLWL